MQATRTATTGTPAWWQGIGKGNRGNGRKAPKRARQSHIGISCCTATSAIYEQTKKYPQKTSVVALLITERTTHHA